MRIRWVAVSATIGVTIAAVALGAAPATAALPVNERRMNDWWPMTVAVNGDFVVYARSTFNSVRPGGYTVYRTDTFRWPIRGAVFNGRRLDGVILRTSAGRTTAGPLATDGAGQHVVAATGANFTPQVTYCCLTNDHDTPIQADGRPRGPVTFAVALQGQVARMLQRDNLARVHLVDQDVGIDPANPLGLRRDRILDAAPVGNLAAVAPGMLAWIDARDGRVHVAAAPVDGQIAPLAEVAAPSGARAIALTEHMLVVAGRDAATGRFTVTRYDVPTWQPAVVWTGVSAPIIAGGDRTVAIAAGRDLLQNVPVGGTRTLVRLRSPAAGLATDGTRMVTLERVRTRVGRRTIKQTAMRIVPVAGPPPVYGQRLAP